MQLEEAVGAEIDVKQAVKLAKDFAARLYEDEKITRLGLEAVDRTEDGKYWIITLGFSRPWSTPRTRKPNRMESALDQMLGESLEPQTTREYKVFRVDAHSGAVVGMEMFE